MHEMSIALELVELASTEARRLGDVRVHSLRLRLGPLAGVVEDALRFAFEVAAEGTAVAGAELHIEHEPVLVWCDACQETRALVSLTSRRCPVCDAPAPEIRAGDALELTAMEISEHAAADR